MNNMIEVRDAQPPALSPHGLGHAMESARQGPGETNVFQVVHRLLRGRYVLAIALGMVGAVGGAMAGYLLPTPKYRSEGQIRYRPLLLNPYTGQESVIPMFNNIVSTGASFAQSDRVIFRAMDSDAWLALGRPRSPAEEQRFKSSLRVTTNPSVQELIYISFTDLDPGAAKVAVEEVIHAYDELYGRGESKSRELAIRTIEDKKRALQAEVSRLQTEIDRESKDYGGLAQLEAQWSIDQQEYLILTRDINLIARQLAGTNSLQPATGEPGGVGSPLPPAVPTPEEVARVDDVMRNYLLQRDLTKQRLERLLGMGYGDAHPEIIQARSDLSSWNTQIQDYAARWVPRQTTDAPIMSGAPMIEQLRNKMADLQRLADEHKKDLGALGTKRSTIAQLERERDAARQEVTETDKRLTGLNEEKKAAQMIGQIEIMPPLAIPSAPNVDPRKKLAVLGFALGGGFPVALVALWGFLDRRFRYADQAKYNRPDVSLLGILPNLPRDMSDPEQAAHAAHSVHQMRTLLQIGGRNRKVYAVTSCTAGDGKTSLTMSLGISFAASGARTLMIDFDMVGRGLSKNLGAAPVHALSDVLLSGNFNGSVVATPIERLSLLPSGRDDGRFVSRLSESIVRGLIERARADYDIVLIDTGPILGSLEANFVSAGADGVIVVVGRGQQRSFVERALEQLAAVGAQVLGLVFNRASLTDYQRSAGSASFRTAPADPLAAKPVTPHEGVAGLDPLSQIVALDTKRS